MQINKARNDIAIIISEVITMSNDLYNFIYPRDSEFVTLDVAGYSVNYMYEYSDEVVHNSDSYNNWIDRFPCEQVPPKEYWGVDWTKPVEVFLHYKCKADMDVENLTKSSIDMIISSIYGEDDNIVNSIICRKVAIVSNYDTSKIAIHIRNQM